MGSGVEADRVNEDSGFFVIFVPKILKDIPMEHLCRFLFIFLLFVSACAGGGSPSRRLLERADSLLDVRPDSALRLLQGVSPRQLADRGGRMHYALLLMQAKYKNYLPVSEDDTLARELAVYYADAGDAGMQARAYYLLGGVYAERQEADHAFRAYHEAARLARQAEDGRTLCLTLNQWAHLCLNHGMAAQGDSLYAETARLARQVGDSVRWAEALLRRGVYALSLGDSAYPRAKQLIEQGYGLARGVRSTRLLQLACYHLGVLCTRVSQPAKALKMANVLLKEAQGDSLVMANACLLAGVTYAQTSRYDSAAVYLRRVLEVGDDMLNDKACGLLAMISEKKKDWEQALHWKKEQEDARRQWQASRQEVEMAVAAREVEWYEAERMQAMGHLPVLFYFLLLMELWVCFLEIKRHLSFNRRQMAQGVEETKNALVQEQKTWDYALFKKQMPKTESYAVIIGILDYHARHDGYERHWDAALEKAFLREVDVLLPGYRMALMDKFPALTAHDVCCCLLFLLDFTDTQIGVLWELNKSTVIRRRQVMLREKMQSIQTMKQDLLKICMLGGEVQNLHLSD